MAEETPGGAGGSEDDVFIDAAPMWDGDEPWKDLPGWVKPVGIISIVWGALGLFCGVVGVGGGALMRQLQQSAANQMQGGMPDVLLNPPASAQAAQIAGVVWSVYLIVGGAFLLARKPAAKTMLLIYALVGVALTTWGLYEQVQVQIAMREWMRQHPDADFTRAAGQSGNAGAMAGLAVGAVLGYAWPLFCLVWFTVVKRKATDITGEGERLEPAA